jgi:uncharacterized protein with HEPN domain
LIAIGAVPSKYDPADTLADIIENAERVAAYLAGMDRQAFERDGKTRDAVERCLERICEAAHRLGERAVELAPNQPWGDIRGMGNRLRHAYDQLDLDIVWNTARDRLPPLAADARRALAKLQGSRAN